MSASAAAAAAGSPSSTKSPPAVREQVRDAVQDELCGATLSFARDRAALERAGWRLSARVVGVEVKRRLKHTHALFVNVIPMSTFGGLSAKDVQTKMSEAHVSKRKKRARDESAGPAGLDVKLKDAEVSLLSSSKPVALSDLFKAWKKAYQYFLWQSSKRVMTSQERKRVRCFEATEITVAAGAGKPCGVTLTKHIGASVFTGSNVAADRAFRGRWWKDKKTRANQPSSSPTSQPASSPPASSPPVPSRPRLDLHVPPSTPQRPPRPSPPSSSLAPPTKRPRDSPSKSSTATTDEDHDPLAARRRPRHYDGDLTEDDVDDDDDGDEGDDDADGDEPMQNVFKRRMPVASPDGDGGGSSSSADSPPPPRASIVLSFTDSPGADNAAVEVESSEDDPDATTYVIHLDSVIPAELGDPAKPLERCLRRRALVGAVLASCFPKALLMPPDSEAAACVHHLTAHLKRQRVRARSWARAFRLECNQFVAQNDKDDMEAIVKTANYRHRQFFEFPDKRTFRYKLSAHVGSIKKQSLTIQEVKDMACSHADSVRHATETFLGSISKDPKPIDDDEPDPPDEDDESNEDNGGNVAPPELDKVMDDLKDVVQQPVPAELKRKWEQLITFDDDDRPGRFYSSQKRLARLLLDRLRNLGDVASEACSRHPESGSRFNLFAFRGLNVRIVVPALNSLERQTQNRLAQDAPELLGGKEPGELVIKAQNYKKDMLNFIQFFRDAHERPSELFILVVDESHWGVNKGGSAEVITKFQPDTVRGKDWARSNSLVGWFVQNAGKPSPHGNFLVLNISATPYAIQSAQSHIPVQNEVQWAEVDRSAMLEGKTLAVTTTGGTSGTLSLISLEDAAPAPAADPRASVRSVQRLSGFGAVQPHDSPAAGFELQLNFGVGACALLCRPDLVNDSTWWWWSPEGQVPFRPKIPAEAVLNFYVQPDDGAADAKRYFGLNHYLNHAGETSDSLVRPDHVFEWLVKHAPVRSLEQPGSLLDPRGPERYTKKQRKSMAKGKRVKPPPVTRSANVLVADYVLHMLMQLPEKFNENMQRMIHPMGAGEKSWPGLPALPKLLERYRRRWEDDLSEWGESLEGGVKRVEKRCQDALARRRSSTGGSSNNGASSDSDEELEALAANLLDKLRPIAHRAQLSSRYWFTPKEIQHARTEVAQILSGAVQRFRQLFPAYAAEPSVHAELDRILVWPSNDELMTETHRIVHSVTNDPVHARAPLKIVRLPNVAIASLFFKAVGRARTLVKMEERFLILRDMGKKQIWSSLKEKANAKWKTRVVEVLRKKHAGKGMDARKLLQKLVYEDFEEMSIPCVLILVDKGRMGDTFPACFDALDSRCVHTSKSHSSTFKSSIVQELGRLCRYASDESTLPYALLTNQLYSKFGSDSRTLAHVKLQPDKYLRWNDAVGSKSSVPYPNRRPREHYLPSAGGKSAPKNMDIDNVGREFDWFRLLLEAEPQIGKTGTYMCFLATLHRALNHGSRVAGADPQHVDSSGLPYWGDVHKDRILDKAVGYGKYGWYSPALHRDVSPSTDPDRGGPLPDGDGDVLMASPGFDGGASSSSSSSSPSPGASSSPSQPGDADPTLFAAVSDPPLLRSEKIEHRTVQLDANHVVRFAMPRSAVSLFDDANKREPRVVKSWLFTPSHQRETNALLNIDACMMDPTSGRALTPFQDYVHVIVVRHREFLAYKHTWASTHIVCQLPQEWGGVRAQDGGVGFSRFVTQQIARKLGLRWVWMLDDNITSWWKVSDEERKYVPCSAVEYFAAAEAVVLGDPDALVDSAKPAYPGTEGHVQSERLTKRQFVGPTANYAVLGCRRWGPRTASQLPSKAFSLEWVYSSVLVRCLSDKGAKTDLELDFPKSWPFWEDMDLLRRCAEKSQQQDGRSKGITRTNAHRPRRWTLRLNRFMHRKRDLPGWRGQYIDQLPVYVEGSDEPLSRGRLCVRKHAPLSEVVEVTKQYARAKDIVLDNSDVQVRSKPHEGGAVKNGRRLADVSQLLSVAKREAKAHGQELFVFLPDVANPRDCTIAANGFKKPGIHSVSATVTQVRKLLPATSYYVVKSSEGDEWPGDRLQLEDGEAVLDSLRLWFTTAEGSRAWSVSFESDDGIDSSITVRDKETKKAGKKNKKKKSKTAAAAKAAASSSSSSSTSFN